MLFRSLHKTTADANQAEDAEAAMHACLEAVCAHTGWPVGHVYVRSPEVPDLLVPTDIWHLDQPERFATFREITLKTTFEPGVGLPGRVLESGKPAWIVDVTKDPNFPRAKLAEEIGVRAGFAVPVLVGYATLGQIGFEGRFHYGAIGTVLNLASRLCDAAETGQILLTQRVHADVEDLAEVEPVGDLEPAGLEGGCGLMRTRGTQAKNGWPGGV